MNYRILVAGNVIEEFQMAESKDAQERFHTVVRATTGMPAALEQQTESGKWVKVENHSGVITKGTGV